MLFWTAGAPRLPARQRHGRPAVIRKMRMSGRDARGPENHDQSGGNMITRRTGLAALALSLGLLPGATLAQFPDKPIRLVVPYAPGGTTDIMARTLQEPLSKALGQPVVVDNKAGAAGAIGTAQVAHAASDGYTLVFGNNGPSAVVPLIQKDVGYDPIKDFAPVSLVSIAPMTLVVHPSSPSTVEKSM